MDFLKILKSFEDFVYEALIWLILVPTTLLRIVFQPRRMVVYAERELASSDEQRFGDSVSPPLLLILCVIIAHLFDLAIRAPGADTTGSLAGTLLSSEQNLLLYRTIAFGVWALAGALLVTLASRRPVNRQGLRGPFYEQCYLVAPFALVLSMATSLDLASAGDSAVGPLSLLAATLWFWLVQVVWVRHRMRAPLWRSVLAATGILLVGAAVNLVVGRALTHVETAPAPAPAEREQAPGSAGDGTTGAWPDAPLRSGRHAPRSADAHKLVRFVAMPSGDLEVCMLRAQPASAGDGASGHTAHRLDCAA